MLVLETLTSIRTTSLIEKSQSHRSEFDVSSSQKIKTI